MVSDLNLGYRIRQFWQVVNVKPLPATVQEDIKSILSNQEQMIFYRCSLSDQWHGYRVLQTLKEAGESNPELLAAALLHDAGKTKGDLTVWSRSWIVIGEKLFPNRAGVWAENPKFGWQRPFAVRKNHAEWGADLARKAGSSTLTVFLIEHHQDPNLGLEGTDADQLLQKLKWADNLN